MTTTEQGAGALVAAIELHCRKCKRSVEFPRSSFPDIPAWVARIEHDKCNLCDDGDRSAEHWIAADGTTPDPDGLEDPFEIRACTVCGCTETTPCIDDAGEPCGWATDDLCTHCDEVIL